MISRLVYRLGLLSVLMLGLLSVISAFATSNIIYESGADDDSIGITANQLKPSECNGLNLTNVVTGSGFIVGTNANDLILGSSSGDVVFARQGDDCVVTGAGNDVLRGNNDNDYLLAGSGDDNLRGNQGTDVCNGQSGSDSGHASCETEIDIP
jgi:Ca2+-binding RTX toxin-like protein